MDLIAQGQTSGLHKFDQRVIHRLQHIFLNDNAELYIFTMKDVLKLLKGFEAMNDYFNREKVIQGLVELVQESTIFEDTGYLEVVRECHERGLLTDNQDLYVKTRVYF